MGSYLVVVNETTGGDRLMAEISRRIAREPSSFFVLVSVPESDAERHGLLDSIAAGEAGPMVVAADLPRRADQEHDVLMRQSRGRLEHLMREVRAAGSEVDGDLADADPIGAIAREVRARQFDEIIISTAPAALSKWLHRDLAHRVERRVRLPVTTVVPEE